MENKESIKSIEITYKNFPKIFVFAENPLNGKIREFFREGDWNRYALILNCCIRSWHIVDQYFHDSIIKLAKKLVHHQVLKEKLHYDEFLSYVFIYKLSSYGNIHFHENVLSGYSSRIDHNFWYRVYDYLMGETEFHCKVTDSSDNLI